MVVVVMQIAGIVEDSIVDGPGLRFVVFTQGCQFRCAGCHNPDTWDESGGENIDVAKLIDKMRANPLTDGLTLSGGEPFEQVADSAQLAAAARSFGLNVWVFTGFVFEELCRLSESDASISEFLGNIDVLVDGPYVESERTLSVKWCQSRNQRVLDIRQSLVTGAPVLLE
ncbi:MAG: anaerobic ribonucleoside-triphosphate reductase activating protein [Oscillospiraceae bacterium]|nr:anaerobic ribonucleoside-triphosphate reductase activating protein [Oscillospiraceae bacterium]MCL2278000.1 anaerobic ribonucleoside-triphosphate reductase activating protein [Oscillospiraceae bacterium]